MTNNGVERELAELDADRLRFERMGRSLVRRFGTRAEIREMNKRIYENHFAAHDSTREERRAAREMWQQGYTLRQIAGKLGRSKGTIWHWSKRWPQREAAPSTLEPVGCGAMVVWLAERNREAA